MRHVVGTIRDITEHKKTEAIKQETEEFLRKVINTTPAHIFVKDREGRFVLANRMSAEAHGMNPEETLGEKEFELPDFMEEKRTEIE